MNQIEAPAALAEAPQNVFAASSPRVAALIAAKDWSQTPLGAPETWPASLRTILDVTLANRFPVAFWWGPQLLQFYNDPYAIILGDKHPRSLGQPFAECWAEIWHVVGPQAESIMQGGPSTWHEDLHLEMNRYGFVEETYFTYSYSALPEPSAPNGIGGVFGTIQETTQKVLGERRMHLLRDLAARGNEAKTVAEECELAVQTLERYASDVPFALIYLIDEDRRSARIACAAAGDIGADLIPTSIALGHETEPWFLDPLQRLESVTLVERGAQRAVVVPIPSNAPNELAGFLIGGVSRKLRFDDAYRDFYALVASQIGTAIAHAHAYEEERRRAQALAELDRAKNVFFSNVSHEFRTPLTLMLGPLSELSKRADAEAKPLVDAAHRNSLRLLKLVNTLLEFSRIEAGRADAAYVETDLTALTEELCSVFRSAIESSGISLEVRMNLRDRVYVDRAMWEKIVLNLLSNALKFTLEGTIRVSLARCGDCAELRVEDTGVGIPASEVPHVFERFRRVRGAKARSHEGSGIGLALVKDLVELHGGSIGVQSTLDHGSTFTVRLPMGYGHLAAERVAHDGSTVPYSTVVEQYLADVDATISRTDIKLPIARIGSRERRKTVLLADDNADLREYVFRILSPHYNVFVARNGKEALELARENAVDIIVSDVMMPEMDGFDLLRAVRDETAISTTPFILLSARAGEESALEGLTRGADDYIAKPFSGEELLARVQANLSAAAFREETWNASEHRFHAFADQLPMMVWQQDASGALVFANSAWYATTHLERDAVSFDPQTWKRVIHPDDYDRIRSIMESAAQTRTAYSFEYRVKPADMDDRSYRWYVASAEPQYAGDRFAGWIGHVADIHDARTRADVEGALRQEAMERERAFHALAEAIPVIAWSADANGWVDWYNSRWYEYTGQTAEDAAGWGWQSAHHPEDFLRVMQEWPQSIATGERFEMEFRLRRHDGVFHWFLTRAEPQKDDSGRVVRWYGSNVDIQAQREAFEQSTRIAETLQGVFLPDALPHTELVRFDATYVAAEKDALIGGDWFDAVQLPDGRFMVSIGDVAGHGLDASVIAGTLRHAVSGCALIDDDPAAILQYANRVLHFQHPDKYATALVGLIDRDCSKLSYACAGHPAPFLAESHGSARSLKHGGLPLGVQIDLELTTHTVPITRDAVLALYTDGLTEFARNIDTAERTLAGALGRLVGNTRIARPSLAVQKAVLGDNPPIDDVAILIAQFSTVRTDAIETEPSALVREWRFHSSDAYTARSCRHELMKFIRQFAENSESLFYAELVLGEILANTVEHAPGLVEIRIDWTGSKPLVTARDSGPGLTSPTDKLPADPLDEDGRGLFLIRSLAEEVFIRRAAGYGSELRAVLPISREASPPSIGTLDDPIDHGVHARDRM